ncbi:MAG: hypothetical protein AAGG48_13255 [Planctomycetota bacterium]
MKNWSNRRKLFAFFAIDFVILVALAPTILSKTSLRDRLINAALEEKSMKASTQSASLGYLTPLSIEGFELNADDGSLQVAMDSMACEKSWLSMLFSGGDLGTIRFNQPSLSVVTGLKPQDSEAAEVSDPSERQPLQGLPTFVAEVDRARVAVRSMEQQNPAIDLEDLTFTIRSEQTDYGSMVQVDPTQILDRQPLTPELCNQGMQLIAPMFADALSVKGDVSFTLDHCVIPVGDLDAQQKQQLSEIDGTIQLSDVTVGLNNAIADQIIGILERFGQTESELRMTVSRSSEVRFQVIDGRVHHQGLMLLLPIAQSDFEFNSSGSVGFDETLDLRFTLALPASVLGDGAIGNFLSSDPLAIQVNGTVSDPRIRLASDQGWQTRLQSVLDSIGSSGDPSEAPSITESAGAVLDIVGGLLDRAEDGEEESAEPGLLDRIRQRREERESEGRRPGLLRRRRQ